MIIGMSYLPEESVFFQISSSSDKPLISDAKFSHG